MVVFGSSANPMDREYFNSWLEPENERRILGPAEDIANDTGVDIKDIGMSLAVGPVPNVQAVGAKLRAGMKTLEIGFMGAGKGSGQQQTPEYYGEKQRQAFREMAKANEVNFTTHSSFGVQGLAGMDQQGNFSKASKNFSVQEIKRAIEFAADVGQGGPVVVHTGEFQRSIEDADWNDDGLFAGYEEEAKRAAYRVIDTRTGGTVQEARKNKTVSRPIWMTAADKDGVYTDKDGNERRVQGDDAKKIYVDYFGREVDRWDRVPVYSEEKGRFETKAYGWTDMRNEAEEMTKDLKREYRKWKSLTKDQKRDSTSMWKGRLERAEQLGLHIEELEVKPEEASIIAAIETNAGNARGWALQYGSDFNNKIKTIKKLEEAKEYYRKLDDEVDEGRREHLREEAEERFGDLVPSGGEKQLTQIDKKIRELKHNLHHSQEASASQWAQAEESMEQIRYLQSAHTYALEESYDSYAKAGIAAMRETAKARRMGRLKNNQPISVAMENLFPESFGAHPDELIKLVENSRKRMARILVQSGEAEGMTEQQAYDNIAKDHITATLDTGHINQWRKYFKVKQGETIEEKNKRFDKWLVGKVADMQKAGIIGHVHLDDNYGYHDDHLAPGEGNAPIKAMVKALKDNGYDGELIVEPGADWTVDTSGFASVMKTWRMFGSHSPGMGAPLGGGATRGWGNVGSGWFGATVSPNFTVGAYSPSEEWTLWSGVPLD